jgi:hypothetical protein
MGVLLDPERPIYWEGESQFDKANQAGNNQNPQSRAGPYGGQVQSSESSRGKFRDHSRMDKDSGRTCLGRLGVADIKCYMKVSFPEIRQTLQQLTKQDYYCHISHRELVAK